MATLSKQQKIAYLEQADQSLLHFAVAFFPEAFTDPFCATIHLPMVEVADATHWADGRRITRKAVAAPRGAGKSTLLNTVDVIRKAVMRRKKYILICSYTDDLAEEHLGTIKEQLETNEKLIEIFGELKGDKWTNNEIRLANGCKIRALGAGGKVRGRRQGWSRPDYALFDDFESRESVQSELILERLKSWRSSDVRNSLDKHTGEEMFVGTVLAGNAILQQDLEDPNVLSVRLELFNDKYESAWPEVYSNERIAQMRDDAIYEGKLDEFWADFRNIPIAGESQKFKHEWFKIWPKDLNWQVLPRFMIVDPARTAKKTSDYSSFCVVGLPFHGEVYLLDMFNDRKVTEAFYEEIYQYAVRWMVNIIYVETNGLDDYILDPLQKYLRRRGLLALVEPMRAPSTTSKQDRIFGLVPLYKLGQIYHPDTEARRELESQLLAHPFSKFDDLADCFSYVNKVMTDRHIGFVSDPSSVYVGSDALLNQGGI